MHYMYYDDVTVACPGIQLDNTYLHFSCFQKLSSIAQMYEARRLL